MLEKNIEHKLTLCCLKQQAINRLIKSERKQRMTADEWKLATVDPKERNTWRSGMQSTMSAASGSQLPERG